MIVLLSWRIANKADEGWVRQKGGRRERETYGYKVPESTAWSCQGRAGWMTKHKTRDSEEEMRQELIMHQYVHVCESVCVWRSGKGECSTAASKSSLTTHKPKKRNTRTKKQEERKKHMARVWILMNKGNANRLTNCDGGERANRESNYVQEHLRIYVHKRWRRRRRRRQESTHMFFVPQKLVT